MKNSNATFTRHKKRLTGKGTNNYLKTANNN